MDDRTSVSIPLPEGCTLHQTAPTSLISVSDGGRLLVSISPDGEVTYGEGVTPTEAAKRFWEAIAAHRPRCPKCGEPLFP